MKSVRAAPRAKPPRKSAPMTAAARALLAFCYLVCYGALFSSAQAHDIPRSQVEIKTAPDGADVTITFSVVGFSLDYPAVQLGGRELAKVAEEKRTVMAGAVADRFALFAGGQALTAPALLPADSVFLPDRKVIRLHLRYVWAAPPKVVEARTGRLFPVDPNHTVFVSVYGLDGKLAREAVLNQATPTLTYEVGSGQGVLSVIGQFVREGVHHIFIGPDHILFIVGLLLLGGGLKRLLKIVTAFTLAHSITLVLATLGIVNPSPRVVEPTIALSIVLVGLHSLSHLRPATTEDNNGENGVVQIPEVAVPRLKGRDLRLPLAFCFGLIHGFGFASVLRELELPREALGWSLFSFNVGVEIGQACIVLTVAPLLAIIARRSARNGRLVATIGSWCVILAGAYWFGQRLAP